MSGQVESLASVIPDKPRIPRRNKRKKTTSSLVLRKEPIRDTVNPRKISHGDTLIDTEKGSQHKTPRPFKNKEDYEGDTDENNCYNYDSQTGDDDCVKKWT